METVKYHKGLILTTFGNGTYYVIWRHGLHVKGSDPDGNDVWNVPSQEFNLSGAWYTKIHIRPLARLFRLEPRFAFYVESEHSILLSLHGSLFKVFLKENGEYEVRTVFSFRSGMNNPLNMVYVEGHPCFADGYYFGEYFGNAAKEAVDLYYSPDGNEWRKCYTFPAGVITHVHNIVRDNDCLYILTGDADGESAVWSAKDDFASVYPVLIGKQQFRSCCLASLRDGFVYATDTPLEDNYLYKYSSLDNSVEALFPLEGSVIYSAMLSDQLFFSSTVEGNSNASRFEQLFKKKPGPGIKSSNAVLYSFDIKSGKHTELVAAKKDIFPFVFQFGVFKPVVSEGRLFVNSVALRKIDGRWFEL